MTNSRRLDRLPVLQYGEHRDDCGVWKIHALGDLPRLDQDSPLLQRDRSKMRGKQSEIRRRKCPQESILSGGLWAIVHRRFLYILDEKLGIPVAGSAKRAMQAGP